jgi:hypothetical protein
MTQDDVNPNVGYGGTALAILSELVQSLEGIREVAHVLSVDAAKDGRPDRLSDEQTEAEEWSAKDVHEYEDSILSSGEQDTATALIVGCREIEDKAVEMIRLCLEFTHPL